MPRAKTTTDVPTDKLDAMLVRLQLSGIRDQLDSLSVRMCTGRSGGRLSNSNPPAGPDARLGPI